MAVCALDTPGSYLPDVKITPDMTGFMKAVYNMGEAMTKLGPSLEQAVKAIMNWNKKT